LKVNQSYLIAKLSAISKGIHANSMESDRADGLQQILFLCKNAKVMLTTNLCFPFGWFNGAIGTIIDLIYRNENRPEKSLPDVVMVQFDNYSGPPFIVENPKTFLIVPLERKIDCNCCGCCRKQIPLRLGWASIIHKCQGMTIGKGEHIPISSLIQRSGHLNQGIQLECSLCSPFKSKFCR
jgi:ATP-dependent exoDNAse (exonuclease V) alpha subunit